MEQSIFNTELTPNSYNIIFSAARWSRFLGVVTMIFAALIFIFGLGLFFFSSISQSELLDAFNQMPQYSFLANVPSFAIALIILIVALLTAFVGYLFYRLGVNGIAFYHSQEEAAFEKTFDTAKNIFLITSIASAIGLLFSIIGLFAFL